MGIPPRPGVPDHVEEPCKLTLGEGSSKLHAYSPPFYPQPSPYFEVSPQQYSIEKLMKMISYYAHMEEDSLLSQKESNRVLEAELKRVQQQRRDAQSRLDKLEKSITNLEEIYEEQSVLLTAHQTSATYTS